MKSGEDISSGQPENLHNDFMDEAHQELNESKRIVNDLMSFRRTAYKSDQVKMDEYLDKAIDAINHLFNDDLPPTTQTD